MMVEHCGSELVGSPEEEPPMESAQLLEVAVSYFVYWNSVEICFTVR